MENAAGWERSCGERSTPFLGRGRRPPPPQGLAPRIAPSSGTQELGGQRKKRQIGSNAHTSNLWAERSAAAATTTKDHARLGVQHAWASSLLNLVPVKIYVQGGATVVVPDLDRIEQQHHYHAALLNI